MHLFQRRLAFTGVQGPCSPAESQPISRVLGSAFLPVVAGSSSGLPWQHYPQLLPWGVTPLSPSSPDQVHTFWMALNFSKSESDQKQWEDPLRTSISIKHNYLGSEFRFPEHNFDCHWTKRDFFMNRTHRNCRSEDSHWFFCQGAVIVPIVCLAWVFSLNSQETPIR